MTDLQITLSPAMQYAIDAENAIRLCRKELEDHSGTHVDEVAFVISTYATAILTEIFQLQESIKKLALKE